MAGEFELKRDFDVEVLEASKEFPIVVDFWAEWCAPCRILGPVLEKLAGEAAGRWRLIKVDTEAYPEISMRYGIRSIPAVKLFASSEAVAEFVGALPEPEIVRWLDTHLPPPAEETAARDEAIALLGTDPERAMELARELDEEDDTRAAILSLGRLIEMAKRDAHDEIGGDRSARRRYLEAALDFARGRHREALATWVELVQTNRALDDDGARRACIAAFRLLGEDDAVTVEMRRPFSMALN